jgi:Tfp pilus assembly protein PilP
MKSAQKGIEMKLIQILALTFAMATMATAQNSSANSQTKASPTPTPTPAASKAGSTAAPATKNGASTSQPATKAGATNAASKTAAKGGATPDSSNKPKVTTTTMPVKGQTAGVPAKGTPTPVVAAKTGDAKKPEVKADAKKTDAPKPSAKKTDAKPAEAKKNGAAKAPAVIAVKPTTAGTKKAGPTPTKAAQPPAKPPAPKVTQVGPATKPAEKPKPSARSFGQRGRRDPFVSPIVSKGGIDRPQPNCTSGKRCLVIPELVLQGTVKDTSGKMMAVVANSTKRTYFLRENDQVFQGSVEKITSDSIIFREYVKDPLGRETAREVVKKLVPAS